jgi:hypothetical protein
MSCLAKPLLNDYDYEHDKPAPDSSSPHAITDFQTHTGRLRMEDTTGKGNGGTQHVEAAGFVDHEPRASDPLSASLPTPPPHEISGSDVYRRRRCLEDHKHIWMSTGG